MGSFMSPERERELEELFREGRTISIHYPADSEEARFVMRLEMEVMKRGDCPPDILRRARESWLPVV
jgi:hypothetical protein